MFDSDVFGASPFIHQPSPEGRPLPHDWYYGVVVTLPWPDDTHAPPFVAGYLGTTPDGIERVRLNSPIYPFRYARFDVRVEAEDAAVYVMNNLQVLGLNPEAALTATVILLPDHDV